MIWTSMNDDVYIPFKKYDINTYITKYNDQNATVAILAFST